ncbi:MAG: hypothetical protein MUF72_20620 [Elainella sp. Prado103]|jgi:hypothetical protein|nr:hypothetical protein [Elainella sp. Prado103]
MTINSGIKNASLSSFVVPSRFRNQILSGLKQTLLTSLLIGFIWLPGLPLSSALAMPGVMAAMPREIAPQQVDSTSIDDNRMSSLITCLPKQLSQPNLKRAFSEMGNDQLERAFNLKANPKLSQAEIDLANCLNHLRTVN